ncbi:MAG: hypothetical protein KC620_16025 [Myxococcales bacterium]|nr:hypothetical protein [Myxococcales bacterium]
MSRYGDPDILPIDTLHGIFEPPGPTERLAHARTAGRALHERLMAAPPVRFYGSFDLIRVPYPVKYGLRDASTVRTPLMHILNRMFVVQFDGLDGVRTLLVSPSDHVANRETPFFKRLGARAAWLGAFGERQLAPVIDTVDGVLDKLDLSPDRVDFLTYDHLHTQDVRRWLGPGGLFPRAKLLVTRQEWLSAHALLPTQADWYCPDGLAGIPADRVVLLDHDVLLGDSVALLRTPGHTEGNHSIAVRTPEGVMVTSENGVCADAYAPEHSRIPGLRRQAKAAGLEVIANGNTLESSVNQYVSMVLEKTVAGPSARDPAFFNIVPSSEMSPYWLFPGLKPTFAFGPLRFGAPS